MGNFLIFFALLSLLGLFKSNNAIGHKSDINVGLIYDTENENREVAFRLAINIINQQGLLRMHNLVAVPRSVEAGNPFSAARTACELMTSSVVGIVGPSTEENANGVQSICDAKEIPYVETRWDDQQRRGSALVNIHPYPAVMSRAYVEVVKAWNWKTFTILYEDYGSLSRVNELFKMSETRGYTIVVRQLDKYGSGNYRPVLKDAWRSDERFFVLDCHIDHLEDVLQQAQQLGLMTNRQHYIITNLDMHTVEMSPYQYSETNITGFRIVDPEDMEVITYAEKLIKLRKHLRKNVDDFSNVAAWKISMDTALMMDALSLFAHALGELEMSENFAMKPLSCNSTDNWERGLSVINFMKTNTIKGLTGAIRFDHQGFRSDFSVDVIELKEGGITKVGNWSAAEGLNISRTYPPPAIPDDMNLSNMSFVVITALTDPYGMLKESHEKLSGNDRYEGFGVDLIHELSLLVGFNYTFIIREDKSNGAKDEKTGKWSGMIGDLMSYRADLAITDLTITAERVEAVDFTSPFMNLGISILFKKPTKAPPNFFSFAEPFALEVWITLAGAYFLVSISLFVMGRLCPSEWNNPYPCIEEPEFLINQFSLRNSFWFTIGSLMQQGTEIAPIAISTRMVAGIWWFFVLIMVSSYTANLAAFLTTESPDSPFSNVKELVERAEYAGVTYGAKANGATANFFRDSNVSEYQKIHQYMQKHAEEVMVGANADGVVKAEKENYAFFMESTSIEYETQRHCNLTQVGTELDEKGYGIAMRKNSPYRNILSSSILKLQESGVIAELKRKWWESKRGGGQCSAEAESQEAKPLNLKNVGGVFWVSVGGIIAASFLVFVEMLMHVAKESIRNGATFTREFVEEMKFYFKFNGMIKPVRNRKSNSKSKSPHESINKSMTNSLEWNGGDKSLE